MCVYVGISGKGREGRGHQVLGHQVSGDQVWGGLLYLLVTRGFDWSSASRATPTSSLIGSPAITASPKANGGTKTGRARDHSNTAGCGNTAL